MQPMIRLSREKQCKESQEKEAKIICNCMAYL